MKNFFRWLIHRPVALINVIGIVVVVLGIAGYVTYQSVRPLDVLADWRIALSAAPEYRVVDGKRVAVYHPGDSLTFTSESNKVADAKGTSSRFILCEATELQAEREIQLDTLSATRAAGIQPSRENAITVPDVTQFQGLPRWCKIVIDVIYEDVALSRDHPEHAETERFLVEELALDPSAIRKQITELNNRIQLLEEQLASTGTILPTESNTPPGQVNQPSKNEENPTAPDDNPAVDTPPTDDGFQLHDLPFVGGLFKGLGL